MASDPRSISYVRLTRATAAERRAGLVGWLRFRQGAYEYDGVRLCRATDGRHVLRFPAKRDSNGVERPYVRPVDGDARVAIEATVIAELRRQGQLP